MPPERWVSLCPDITGGDDTEEEIAFRERLGRGLSDEEWQRRQQAANEDTAQAWRRDQDAS